MRAWGAAQIQEQSKEACSACVCVCYAHSSPERDMFLGMRGPCCKRPTMDNGQCVRMLAAVVRWAMRCGRRDADGRKRDAVAGSAGRRRLNCTCGFVPGGACSFASGGAVAASRAIQGSTPSKPLNPPNHRKKLRIATICALRCAVLGGKPPNRQTAPSHPFHTRTHTSIGKYGHRGELELGKSFRLSFIHTYK